MPMEESLEKVLANDGRISGAQMGSLHFSLAESLS